MQLRPRSVVLALLAACSLLGAAGADEASLPGGAASLREAHGDWTTLCALQDQNGKKAKHCTLSQEQFAKDSRQRVLSIEIKPDGGGAKGLLILPFGLLLEKGASYQLDGGQQSGSQRFRTCLPIGCLIDLALDAKTIAAFSTAKALKVNATAADGGQSVAFTISLSGFTGAFERTQALLK